MLTALVAAVMVQPTFVATRFDMGERLKALDVAWMSADRTRRRAALPKVSSAVGSFLGGGVGTVCRLLDEAVALLEGRTLRREDALTFRFDPPFAEPGSMARLRATWCYDPGRGEPIEIRASGVRQKLEVGVSALLQIDTRRLNPDGREPEVGVLASIQAGSARQSAYVSIVKSLPKRLDRLADAKNPAAKNLVDRMRAELASLGETDLPLIDLLLLAEELESGETQLGDVEQLPYARHGSTVLRAAIPKGVGKEATVVVALHGAGGSENLFFEGYGRGLAVREALGRGWVLLSPRVGRSAVQDAIDWLREVRGVETAKLIVLGHSMGGAMALATGEIHPKPKALALFAPAAAQIPEALADVPLFVAVGKQETPMLARMSQQLAAGIKDRPTCRFVEVDPSEHLMIVADALPQAFRFFDELAAR